MHLKGLPAYHKKTIQKERIDSAMSDKLFLRVEEVAEILDISIPFAYKLIRKMNEELRKTGCITIAGRIDRKFFYEHFYSGKGHIGKGEK